MESRKLIKLGNSSFAVALPKDWVTKSGLKKGDNIFIVPNSNGELMVSPTYQNRKSNDIKYIDLIDTDLNDIGRELLMAYIHDNSAIHVKGLKNKDKKLKVKSLLSSLAGLEVMELNKEEILLKDFFDFEEAKIENFVRRMDNAIRSMFDELQTAITKLNLNSRQNQEIIDAEKEIDKFYFIITKILFKGLNNPAILNTLKTDSLSLFHWWWVAFNIEHVGDELKKVSQTIHERKINKEEFEKVSKICNMLSAQYTNFFNAFYKRDFKTTKSLLIKNREIMNLCREETHSESTPAAKVFWSFDRIQNSLYQINIITLYGGI